MSCCETFLLSGSHCLGQTGSEVVGSGVGAGRQGKGEHDPHPSLTPWTGNQKLTGGLGQLTLSAQGLTSIQTAGRTPPPLPRLPPTPSHPLALPQSHPTPADSWPCQPAPAGPSRGSGDLSSPGLCSPALWADLSTSAIVDGDFSTLGPREGPLPNTTDGGH